MITNSSRKSLAAQPYYPPAFTESVFAQACVLARTMGLHQKPTASGGIGVGEAEERLKVFKSLYLRDKSLSISQGSVCWLPSCDCSLSSELSQIASADSNCAARIPLARLQEDIYRVFHSPELARQSSAIPKSALLRIEQDLERWAHTHDIFSSPFTGIRDIDLQLEFLAARISAFRGSSEPNHVHRVLNDARASCLLLLISYGKHDRSTAQLPETLPISKSPSKPLDMATGRLSSNSKTSKNDASGHAAKEDATNENAGDVASLRFHPLLDTFSVAAFFLLVKNIIWPVSPNDESYIEEDVRLLGKVCACYKELDAKTQADNYIRKVGHAFERLLEIVNTINNYAPAQTSMYETCNRSSTSPNPQTFLCRSQGLSDFSDLPVPSAYPMPFIGWDGISVKNTSARTADSASTNPSPGLLTPMEADFFSPQFQQKLIPSNRKRPRLSPPDTSLEDYAGSRMLSDFLATSPMMSFDLTTQEDMTTTDF
jgi:hypothetical protein